MSEAEVLEILGSQVQPWGRLSAASGRHTNEDLVLRSRLAADYWLKAPEEEQIIAEPQLESFDRETE